MSKLLKIQNWAGNTEKQIYWSKVKWRFRQIYWPSQKTQTLPKLQILSHTFWSKNLQKSHSGTAKRVVKVQLPGGKVVTFALRRRSLILLACAGAIRYPYIEGNGQAPYHQVVRITIRIVDVSIHEKNSFR